MKTVKHKIACILLATFAASAAFAADPYIASTADGTLYAIDTGFVPGPDTKIFADFEFVGKVADIGETYGQIVFEATSADKGYARIYITGGGKVGWAFTEPKAENDTSIWVSTGVDMEVGKRYTMDIDATTGKTVFTYDGKTKTIDFPEGNATIQAANSIMLFANRSRKNSAMMKLYHFQIWKAGTLVHDYVAAKRDGENGLYDAATGVFRPDGGLNEAASNAPFVYGGDLQDVGTGWLESDGTVAFDSGYYFNADSRIEVDFSFTENANGDRIWGASANTETVAQTAAFYQNKSGNFSFLSGPASSYGTASLGIAADTARHVAIYDIAGQSACLITSGVTNKTLVLSNEALQPSAQSDVPIGIFADCTSTDGKTFSNHFSKSRIYRIKFFTDGEPVKDYIPYVKEGVPGFKDTISGEFIESATAGVPAYGGNIAGEWDAYLESDGTQGINTGYHMKNTTRVEIDFAYTYHPSITTHGVVFGAHTSTDNRAAAYVNGNNLFTMRHDSKAVNKTKTFTEPDLLRHKAIVDAVAKKMHYVSGSVTNTIDNGGAGGNYSSATPSQHPMGIFAAITDADGATFSLPANMKLYSFRIYETENNVETLVHEYLPYKGADGTLGLFDTVNPSAAPLTDTYTAGNDTAFVYGGKGVDGAEKWLVVPQNCKITKAQGTVTLTANASGAVSYRWTKNGEAIEGGEDGVLDVAWRRGGKTDTYAVSPVYEMYGVAIVGESVSCEVENVPLGMMVIIR
ncbi:MAG: hypothetical protein IJ173_03030 [Kiritimatiellae bacterium]|nr:hypothetical protein [Kiritimatiellia bacterium]